MNQTQLGKPVQLYKARKLADIWAYVDEADFDQVSQHKWNFDTGYARGTIDGVRISMHTFVMNMRDEVRPDKSIIDHKNMNRLDNTSQNLRYASMSQNSQNKPKRKGTSSEYIGVSRTAHGFFASSKLSILGVFSDEIDAAKAYDAGSLITYGEFARTNNLVSWEEVKNTTLDDVVPKHIYINNVEFRVNKHHYGAEWHEEGYSSEQNEVLIDILIQKILNDHETKYLNSIIINARTVVATSKATSKTTSKTTTVVEQKVETQIWLGDDGLYRPIPASYCKPINAPEKPLPRSGIFRNTSWTPSQGPRIYT